MDLGDLEIGIHLCGDLDQFVLGDEVVEQRSQVEDWARVLDLPVDDADDVLSGQALRDSGIQGAVESDFFDWVLLEPDGRDLVLRLARQVARFRLRDVEADVLKALYERQSGLGHQQELAELAEAPSTGGDRETREVPSNERVAPVNPRSAPLQEAVRDALTLAPVVGLGKVRGKQVDLRQAIADTKKILNANEQIETLTALVDEIYKRHKK